MKSSSPEKLWGLHGSPQSLKGDSITSRKFHVHPDNVTVYFKRISVFSRAVSKIEGTSRKMFAVPFISVK